MSKVLLVTGASRGIGAAIARLAASNGWSVAVNYHSPDSDAAAVVDQIKASGSAAIAIQADVANEDAVKRIFDTCAEELGQTTGLVNNSGISHPAQKLADMSLARWQSTFNTNVTGCFLCTREAARRMSTRSGGDGGVIVNLSSMAATLGGADEFVDYAALKGAIDAMTVGLSKEFAKDGIRVYGVRPGLIETDMQHHVSGKNRADNLVGTVPLGRVGTPDEVAEAVIWLLSDAAAYVTGSTIAVSGGR